MYTVVVYICILSIKIKNKYQARHNLKSILYYYCSLKLYKQVILLFPQSLAISNMVRDLFYLEFCPVLASGEKFNLPSHQDQ